MKLIFHRSQKISNPYTVVLLTDEPGFHKEVGNFPHSCYDEVITSLMSLITWCDCLMCLLTWCDCVISQSRILFLCIDVYILFSTGVFSSVDSPVELCM